MTGPIARSAESISGVFRAFFTAEQVASEGGFLQRRDPRVSIFSIAMLAIAVMITRTVAVSLVLGGATLVLAWRSSVPLGRLVRRSAVVPLVSTVIVLPQAVLMPGEAVVRTADLAVTDTGMVYVVMFALRVGVGVSLLSVLVMTTPFTAIVAAMKDLQIPVTLVWVVAITYRYLFLFFDELRRVVIARNSRTTGAGDIHEGWRDARRIAGTFFLRTLDRGERVGRGIRARGGARPPSPYGRSHSVDCYDYLLFSTALVAVTGAGVIRWIL